MAINSKPGEKPILYHLTNIPAVPLKPIISITDRLKLKKTFMRKLFQLLSVMSLLLLSTQLYAQQKTITGTVRDEDGNKPLAGVSILIKGETHGAQTDASGSFSIQAPKGKVLVISYLGFETQEVKVG